VRIGNFPPVFGQFCKTMFLRTFGRGGGIVMEYARDMAWCDPSAADPLSNAELKVLGVGWLKASANAAQDVCVTRLHTQYSRGRMIQDPVLRETDNRVNFQGRYIMNQPFEGSETCEFGARHVRDTRARIGREANDLVRLTGWSGQSVRANIARTVSARHR